MNHDEFNDRLPVTGYTLPKMDEMVCEKPGEPRDPLFDVKRLFSLDAMKDLYGKPGELFSLCSSREMYLLRTADKIEWMREDLTNIPDQDAVTAEPIPCPCCGKPVKFEKIVGALHGGDPYGEIVCVPCGLSMVGGRSGVVARWNRRCRLTRRGTQRLRSQPACDRVAAAEKNRDVLDEACQMVLNGQGAVFVDPAKLGSDYTVIRRWAENE